jgi:hypothetical protein
MSNAGQHSCDMSAWLVIIVSGPSLHTLAQTLGCPSKLPCLHVPHVPKNFGYSGSTPVGNATLAMANVLTCNKHSQKPFGTVYTLKC